MRLMVALSALAVMSTGCTTEKIPQLSDEYLYTLENVAGACVIDGVNVRESNPLPNPDRSPSDTKFGEIIHTFDTNGIREDGVQISSKYDVLKDPKNYICFDITDGEVPVTITKRANGGNRYWYTFSREELAAQVGEQSIAMKALIQAAIDESLEEVVIASDGVAIASKLGEDLKLAA